MSIQLFGSPSGLCSSITESKHIKAVKEPRCWSSRYKALKQNLQVLVWLDKIAALRCHFTSHGTLRGTIAEYMAGTIAENSHEDPTPLASEIAVDEDGAPIEGDSEKETLSILTLSAKTGVHVNIYSTYLTHVLNISNHRKWLSTEPP